MWIATLLSAVQTWMRYRRTVRELSRLDDRTLRDIGLHRSEIDGRARKSAAV